MKKMILAAVAAMALPSAAFAAETAPTPKPECCCEKMHEGKGCCAEKEGTGQHDHGGHNMDSPKS